MFKVDRKTFSFWRPIWGIFAYLENQPWGFQRTFTATFGDNKKLNLNVTESSDQGFSRTASMMVPPWFSEHSDIGTTRRRPGRGKKVGLSFYHGQQNTFRYRSGCVHVFDSMKKGLFDELTYAFSNWEILSHMGSVFFFIKFSIINGTMLLQRREESKHNYLKRSHNQTIFF